MLKILKLLAYLFLIIIFSVLFDQFQAQQKPETNLHNTPQETVTPTPEKNTKTSAQQENIPSDTENERKYTLKDIIDIVESVATILAIIAGGAWAFHKFIVRRQKYPQANLTHEIKHLFGDDDKIILHVKTRVENIGNILIQIESGFTRLQRVLPFPKDEKELFQNGKVLRDKDSKEIPWTEIEEIKRQWEPCNFEIEPGESDEVCFEFLLNPEDHAILIYSHFENIKKTTRDLGWGLTSIYDLRKPV